MLLLMLQLMQLDWTQVEAADWNTHNISRAKWMERNRQRVHGMFTFAYDSYLKYAFPLDELDPIHCTGRGVDLDRPDNININDVLGNYSLTLIDTLDTLAIMGNRTAFVDAVRRVIAQVSFDQDSNVQVFEVTIRVLGGLLSAHMIAMEPRFNMHVPGYGHELLDLARDLAARLLPAFDNTATGLPHPRVNLRHGVLPTGRNDTVCFSCNVSSLFLLSIWIFFSL